MASLNRVMLIGNVGKDVEIRYAPSGDAIANLTIATSESWKDKSTGERKEATEWHRVVFFGKLAEVCGQYVKKGAQLYIEGSLVTRKWQDKEGQDRYTTEIRGSEMKMLGRRESAGEGGGYGASAPASAPARQPAPSPQPAAAGGGGSRGFNEFDDIPFMCMPSAYCF